MKIIKTGLLAIYIIGAPEALSDCYWLGERSSEGTSICTVDLTIPRFSEFKTNQKEMIIYIQGSLKTCTDKGLWSKNKVCIQTEVEFNEGNEWILESLNSFILKKNSSP